MKYTHTGTGVGFTAGIIVLLLLVAMTIGFPWAAFWALEVLFGYAIPYTLRTVVAFWVMLTVANLVHSHERDIH